MSVPNKNNDIEEEKDHPDSTMLRLEKQRQEKFGNKVIMIESLSDTDDILTKIEASLEMIEASCEESDSIMNDSRANQNKSKESKEDSSITTNSSLSVEKRGCL